LPTEKQEKSVVKELDCHAKIGVRFDLHKTSHPIFHLALQPGIGSPASSCSLQ